MKIIELTLALAGIAAYCLSWALSFWLWKAMPTQPDSIAGFTVPMIIHGRTIYLNTLFNVIYNSLFWGGLALFFIAVLIDSYKDPYNWRSNSK